MRARGPCLVVAGVVVALVASAVAETTPTKVDSKPFRDELIVLQDRDGGTYVVKPRKPATDTKPETDARIWFGTAGKELYEQGNMGRSSDGAGWTQNVWAPRVPQMRPGQIGLKKDGSYSKWCDVEVPLTQVTGDKAKSVLDRSPLMTEYMMRRAHILARDDSGVYYYVDKFHPRYGGKGFRVWVGKKGAMKLLALTDVASDSAGEVFSTKTGDLRLTRTASAEGSHQVMWIRGEKRQELISLDVDANAMVIWSELGIYKFMGTICDNL
ncbi:MAG: hypothetical protein ABI867_45320 [Kofleriaceae bacterium]